jgi:hypothetical protein
MLRPSKAFALCKLRNAASDGFGCVSCAEVPQSDFSRHGDLGVSPLGSKMVAIAVRSGLGGAQL